MRHWVWTQQLCARGLETRHAERRQGLAGFQGTAPSHRSATSAAGVEGAGGSGGPGRGAGGRWRGMAGLRDDAPRHTPARQSSPVWRAPEGPEGTGGLRDRPLRAKLACGDLAGGRARRRPEHQRCHTATTRGMDGERAGRPRGGRRSVGGTSDNSRIYSPARRSTSCMMRPHTALTHATAATPRTRERQGRICRKSSKP